MRAIYIIGINTYREIIRDRVLYGIFVMAILLIGLSLALGELSFAEQARITTSFGLTAIQLGAVILSIFLGSTLVTREIEKKTVMTLLIRPVTRMQFLLGKSLGLLLVQLTVMTLLGLVLIGIYHFMQVNIRYQFIVALHGIMLEAMTLLGITLFFSIFATPAMVVAFSSGIFLIGHWLDSLSYFVKKGQSDIIKDVVAVFVKFFPNFEHFNWRQAVIYEDVIPMDVITAATGYGIIWFALLIFAAGFILRHRDFA